MHNPHTINLLLFNPDTVLPQRAEPNTVADDIQRLNTSRFPILVGSDKFRAHLDGALHDALREVGIRVWVPVVFLEGATDDRTTA